jgi:DNA-binding NarL/FixJ family response regulator
MEDLCTSCPHRLICSNLCPEAEAYASQDEKAQTELNIGLPRHGKWPERREKSLFTDREMEIIGALLDGRTREEIAKELGITRKNLREHLRHIRKKRQQKLPFIEGSVL